MSKSVVVAGGGMTGLAAAYRLKKLAKASGADANIILVEQEERLGGKVQTEIHEEMVIEAGPESFIAHKPWFQALCTELGITTVGTNPKIHKTYIVRKGRLEPIPAGMQMMIPTEIGPFVLTRLLSPLGKLRAALEPLIPVRKSTEDESMASFVTRRFGREVADRIAGPLMGGPYGGSWNRISLKATFPQFMTMEQTHGNLLLAARKQKLKLKQKPNGSSVFQTVPDGLRRVVDGLIAASSGVTFKTGIKVAGLTQTEAGQLVTLTDGTVLPADGVVLAIPASGAATLLHDQLPAAADLLKEIPYQSAVVVTLAFRAGEIAQPLDASGFVVPYQEGMDLSACTFVSAKWLHAAPPNVHLLRCYLDHSKGRDWAGASDEVLIAAVRGALKSLMGITAEPIVTRIHRWPKAMPQYLVGHLGRMDRLDELMKDLPSVALAGAAYRGVGLSDCVREGFAAADRMARRLGWLI